MNLRKALYYSIDNEAIVDTVLGDGSEAVNGIVPRELALSPETKKDFVEDINKNLTQCIGGGGC